MNKDSRNVQCTAAFAFDDPEGTHRGCSQACLAVVAQEFDLRMLVQRAHFTIHGDSAKLNSKEGDKSAPLVCYCIAPEFRRTLWEGLQSTGIDRGFLFPDPDNMARSIMDEQRLLATLR